MLNAEAGRDADRAAGAMPGAGLSCAADVRFRIEGYFLLAPGTAVRAVAPAGAATRIPGARKWVLGLMDFEGRLMPMVDLATYLRGDHGAGLHPRGARILVVEGAGLRCALAVHEVLGSGSDAHSAPMPAAPVPAWTPAWLRPLVRGCVRDDGRPWLFFDLHSLLGSGRFLAGAL